MTTLHFQNIKDQIVKDPSKQETSPIKLCINIEERVKAKILKDRIRIREFFRDYDKLRKGYTSYAYFVTAINTLNIGLEEFEIKQLLDTYTMADGNIDYVSFCDSVDQVFQEGADTSQVVNTIKSTAIFAPEELQSIQKTLEKITTLISTNRILLKPIFQDFDKTRVGHVTDFQFARVLKQSHLMPADNEFELLTRKYKDLNNLHEVNYIEFLKEVDKPLGTIETKPFQFTSTPEFFTKPQVSQIDPTAVKTNNILKHNFLDATINLKANPENVEQRIQATVVMKGIRVEEFFRDFDKLKKGTVTQQKLRSVTAMLGISLTEQEYEALSQKYITPDNLFNYHEFAQNINKIFTNIGLQKDPTADVKQINKNDTLLARKCELPIDQETQDAITTILSGMIRCMKIRRISIKPFFQNFDIPKSGFVTKSQFSRVLSEVGIVINETQLSTLLKHYMNRGTMDDINYVEFVKDIERLDTPFQPIYKDTSYDAAVSHKAYVEAKKDMQKTILKYNPQDIEDVLARIRGSVKEQRIRIAEFMRDYDKLRSGFITISQFRIALNMAKIAISETEFNILADNYGNEDKSKLKWNEFCDKVDEVFTLKELEKAIDTLPEKLSTETKFWKPTISEEESKLLDTVLAKFKEFMIVKKVNPRVFFQEWDKHNCQKVSLKQFRQVLTVLGFNLTNDEASVIFKRYSNVKNDVMYQAFLTDCGYTPMIGVDGQDFTKDFQVAKPIAELPKKDVVLDQLLLKIKNEAKMNRLRMIEFFQDYDILKKGCVPPPKFRSALEALKLNLTIEDYEMLEQEFKSSVDPYKIDYVHLCLDIESIFTNPQLQKKPCDQIISYELSKIIDPEDRLNDQEEKEIDELMKKLAITVKAKHLLVKPMFQDKDKAKSGVVQDTRFRSILDFHSIKLSDAEYKLLRKRYVIE